MERWKSKIFEPIRIYLGLGLFAKGVYFAGHLGVVMSMLDLGGISAVLQVMLAHLIALAHLCGGLLLAAGLLTRLAAAVQVPILLGAVFLVHLREGLFASQNLEFAALVLFLLLLTVVYGGGPWSADHFLARREQRLIAASHGISGTA